MSAATSLCTQMIMLPISTSLNLNDKGSRIGKIWARALSYLEQAPSFNRLYWGRHVEDRETVRTHVGIPRIESLSEISPCSKLLRQQGDLDPTRIHSRVQQRVPSLGKGAPMTSTAIYLNLYQKGWDEAWKQWIGIIQGIPGFMGIASGLIVEAVDGHDTSFIALVGWQNVEAHDAYHHTKHFRERRHILLNPAKGSYNHYGHIAFNDG